MPGIFWALAVGFGYFAFFWPGLILHAACILDAAFHKGEDSWFKDSLPKRLGFLAFIAGLLAYIVVRNF